MKLWSAWPEGSEMDAVFNYDLRAVPVIRTSMRLPGIFLYMAIPRRWAWRAHFKFRVCIRRQRSPFVWWKQLYYDYARDCVVIYGKPVPFERLEDLALQLEKEKREVFQ